MCDIDLVVHICGLRLENKAYGVEREVFCYGLLLGGLFVCFFSETVLLYAFQYITERNNKVRAFVRASCRMYMPTCKWEFQTVEYLL